MSDWDEPSTLLLLALLVGVLLGTLSGGMVVLDHYEMQVDNRP